MLNYFTVLYDTMYLGGYAYTNHVWRTLVCSSLDLCSQESTTHQLLFYDLCHLKFKSNQSNIFDNTKKQNKQTDENEKITTKCIQKNSKTTC